MPEPFTPPSIVVGVDGSRAAVRAALWAIDEAVSRDIPLRLMYTIDPSGSGASDSQEEASQQASAELAVRYAANAVESTERPVKVEIDILSGHPVATLVEASRFAAMVCVGAVGLKHFDRDRIGSTATALIASAHCPVAMVRGSERATAPGVGWVVVELDESPDSAAVLQSGVQEARLRGAPLRVLSSWQSRYTDVHDTHAVSDGNRMVRAQLDRRLSHWKHQYPDLDARPVAIHGSVLNYLAKHGEEIQLVVVGARNAVGIEELLGPTGSAALHNTDCSVLVIDRQRLL
ncbi:nucleotide-binding universal stress UspA family protein [Mycolicibacterium sp. BK556]|uniref:universal stress protein n=1 Tax=Mycobacteriaceae TaxID=1762 RepID=UPI001061C225|nr:MULTISPECIES: universal stress protein [Mycobacteriaceae]MBB3602991.1 nucleotide-binding universal stress UspA family protein [Mycolicibacterium sp. BK556]MBB3633186.1 nucleotide-binding universal stress UspA family protein [Mycolicibacterium sp. BK607]